MGAIEKKVIKDSLIKRFSLLSLATFLLAGFALGAILTSSLERAAIDRSKHETAQFVVSEVDRLFPGMDFSLPMTDQRYEEFQESVTHFMFNPSIKRVKVWNLDRVIVWSDERQLVGKRFPDNKELVEALNGAISSGITSPRKYENLAERQYTRILELYVPIHSKRDGNIKAVFEIYQDIGSLEADIARLKRILWIAILGGFAIVYFACFAIVWNASRRITEQTLEIEKSEERSRDIARELTSLINNVPGIIYRGHKDWSLSFIGAEVKSVTGYTPDEFTSGSVGWMGIIHPDDLEQVKGAFRKATREKSDILRVEYRIRHKDSGIRWIADRRQLFYDESGVFDKVEGLLLDITDRKETESKLHASHHRFRALADTATDGIINVDAQGTIVFINPSAERQFGYASIELLGKNITVLIPERYRTAHQRGMDRYMKTGASRIIGTTVQLEGLKKGGSVFPIELSLATWEGMEGRLFSANIRDITERKQAEEALRESEAFIYTILDNLPIGIAVNSVDPEVKFIYMNDNFPRFYRVTREALADPDSFWDAVYEEPEFREEIKKRVLDDCASGDPERMHWVDVPITRKGNETTFISAMNTPIPGKKLMISSVWDVTDRKRSEEEKELLQSQLHQAMKMEAVGRLAGGVAHDFNNLLTAIIGNISLAQMKLSSSDPLVDFMTEANKAAERAATLTKQLLAFSRKQIIEPKLLDLNELIAGLHTMLARLIGEHIVLETIPEEDLGVVKVDRGQFEQILVNLAVNARDAMPEGGKLLIETANVNLDEAYCARHPYVRPGRFVMLAVSDTGHGMSAEVKKQIFEPFFTTKPKGTGTGLGLATIYGVVKQSDGFIEVYSEVGKGTTFKIYLPRVEGEAARPQESDLSLDLLKGAETVLLVEDEEIVRNLCVQILERLGYRVMQASNGDEALALAMGYRERIDLLFTDVVMLGMNGRDLADQLTRIRPETRVLFTSGYTDDAIVHHGVLDEGVSFIGKPYSISGLARKIREVLDKV